MEENVCTISLAKLREFVLSEIVLKRISFDVFSLLDWERVFFKLILQN